MELIACLTNALESNSPIIDIVISISSFAEQSRENQLILGNNGACELLVSVLNKSPYAEDPNVTEAVMTSMRQLCRRTMSKDTACPENCERTIYAQAGKQILDALSTHIYDSPKVATAAMYLIMILASDSDHRIYALEAAGAPIALAAVLFKYSADPSVVEMGCRAVRNMASHNDSANAMVSEGICESIVQVLKDCKCMPEVVASACWAIVNLSCDCNISTIFGSAGGCTAVLAALQECRHDTSAVIAGCAAIRNLTSESNMNFNILIRTDVASIINDLLALHTSLELRESIYWMAANISSSVLLSQRLFDLGVFQMALNEAREIFAGMAATYQQASSISSSSSSSSSLSCSAADDLDNAVDVLEACLWLIKNTLAGSQDITAVQPTVTSAVHSMSLSLSDSSAASADADADNDNDNDNESALQLVENEVAAEAVPMVYDPLDCKRLTVINAQAQSLLTFLLPVLDYSQAVDDCAKARVAGACDDDNAVDEEEQEQADAENDVSFSALTRVTLVALYKVVTGLATEARVAGVKLSEHQVLLQCQVCDRLCWLLRLKTDSRAVTEHCLLHLEAMLASCDQFKEVFAARDGASLIVAACSRHNTHKSLLSTGCKLLGRLKGVAIDESTLDREDITVDTLLQQIITLSV